MIDGEAGRDGRAAGGAVDLVDPGDGLDRAVEAVDEETGDAMIDQFGHRAAIAGDDWGTARHRLDHREAEKLVEIDQVEQRTGRTQRPRAGVAGDRAVVDDPSAVDRGRDLALVIALILNDARHHQPTAGAARDFDRFGGALVGMDAAEEQQVFAADRIEGEFIERDAMMDRGGIRQLRVPIGIADRDIGDAILIALEDRHDPFGREAVDGGDERGFDQAGEGEQHEIGLVVDEIELAGALEDMGDVEQLPDLGIDARVFGIGTRTDAGEGAGPDRWIPASCLCWCNCI